MNEEVEALHKNFISFGDISVAEGRFLLVSLQTDTETKEFYFDKKEAASLLIDNLKNHNVD